jgi:small conductance mechanosensitive channel
MRLERRLAVLLAILLLAAPGGAQEAGPAADEAGQRVIDLSDAEPRDAAIQSRIENIFAQIDALSGVSVSVVEGVVKLSGQTANEAQAQRAVELAARVEGVVTLEDNIDRTLDVESNLAPVVDDLRQGVRRFQRALPLYLVALVAWFVMAWLGHQLAKWTALWRRLAPNVFLAELLAQAVRIVAFFVGLIIALDILGASALIGTVLGGAGVVGLAIGFAVRDTLENYISSIMLSLRQPFRAGDHVVINEHEGVVVRLTSRATILMTLDGNHLRIPNSNVFKAVILNYTRNPERRFTFELGIDANDDPLAAMATGISAIEKLEFVLAEPGPTAMIQSVGDSNIVIWFSAWVNQQHTDFGKGRSLSIHAAKAALEGGGFTLPEPIYRLRFDGAPPVPQPAARPAPPETVRPAAVRADNDILDTRPDEHLDKIISEEREQEGATDLLDTSKPIE